VAAGLAEAFLLDTLATVEVAGLVPRVICRDAEEREALRALVGDMATVHCQGGAGLGDALESAFRQGLGGGATVVGVLGADVPTVPPEVLADGCRAVAGGYDVSLGLSDDGGYYLLAARDVHPVLFRDMVWSTASVGAETLARARAAGLHTHLLPRWYDVDDAVALGTLRADLARTADGIAPRTRAALSLAARPAEIHQKSSRR
jgi:glycosyltransferase A (GT-A) superfamily protein (DUF2064 family)